MQEDQTQKTPTTKSSTRTPDDVTTRPAPTARPSESARTSDARGIVAAAAAHATDVASRALDGTSELLGHVKDEAVESYHHLEHQAGAIARQAEDALERGFDETVRAGGAVTRFVSTHAVPLLVIGAGFGLLRRSMRRERQRVAPPVRPRVRREPVVHYAAEPRPDDVADLAPRSTSTTPGAKLMGVRMSNAGYPER